MKDTGASDVRKMKDRVANDVRHARHCELSKNFAKIGERSKGNFFGITYSTCSTQIHFLELLRAIVKGGAAYPQATQRHNVAARELLLPS
jgi:hypothetical protein